MVPYGVSCKANAEVLCAHRNQPPLSSLIIAKPMYHWKPVNARLTKLSRLSAVVLLFNTHSFGQPAAHERAWSRV